MVLQFSMSRNYALEWVSPGLSFEMFKPSGIISLIYDKTETLGYIFFNTVVSFFVVYGVY